MGKAQSKRSVDITTETKKVGEDEITEKMEKIEDIDKKEVINGDAIISDKIAQEKKDAEDVENDKDMTTEKDEKNDGEAVSAENQNTAETPKEEGGGSANAEEISPLADESIKKSKKEKVKKKWSFRSISFGKKDKQKPAKTEDATEDGSELTNGADTDEKTVTEPEDNQKDKTINEKEENTTEGHENGNATPQEIKGEQNEEKKSEDELNAITANNTNNTTTTTEISETVQNETAVVSSEISEKTENSVIATSNTNENKTSEDAAIDDATKNGNGVDEKTIATEQTLQNEVTNATVEAPSEKTSTMGNDVTNESSSTNGEVIDKIQQNGDHGESEQEIVEKSKEQNEVNFNTDNKISAATLDYNSSTSTNPSNIQIHVQDLNTSSEKPDENINKNHNESIGTPDDIEAKPQNNSQTEVGESVNTTEELKIETIENKETETNIDNEMLTENKVGVEPSPQNDTQPAIGELTNMTEDLEVETIENKEPESNSDNEKSTEDNAGIEPSPPPLPISPPPSQVSVFAFTNNESVEDSSKDFERTIENVVDEREEISPPSASVCEPSNAEITNSNENLNEEKVNDSPIEQKINVDENNENNDIVATECDKTQEEYRDLTSQNEEEISVATEVINEITEKAAAIVNEQLKCSEEQIMDEQSLECNKLSQEENKNDDDIVNECTVVEFDNEKENDKEEVDVVSGITSCSNENPIVIEQTNNIPTDCSLDFSATNFIPDDQDQMSSLNKSDNLDEEHLNPTKESANTKDLKDNVAAAEITQDLSVTCE